MYGYDTFHPDLMRTLINSIHSKTTSQTYIFEGDNGLNLFESARLFAAALTCANPQTAPCTECSCCMESAADTNPDIIYFEKPSDKKTIGIAPIRELTDSVIIKPFHSDYKVYIIREGDLLTEEAQNGLLKTLEEPPSYVVFIIITTNKDIMLQTVLSRATLVHFPPVKDEVTEKYLEEKYPEAENKQFLIKYSEGIPGRIDEIMSDDTFYAVRGEALNKLPHLLTKNKLYAFEIRKYLESEKDDAEKIIDFWISFMRDILIIQMGAPKKIINQDKSDELYNLANRIDPKLSTSALENLFTAKEMLRRFVSIKSLAIRLALKTNG